MKKTPLISPIVLAVSLVLFGNGCSDSSSGTSGEMFVEPDNDNDDGSSSFDEFELVSHITNNVISPAFESFNTVANEFESAVSQYCISEQAFLDGSISEQERSDNKAAAQQAWRNAMGQWQKIEVMQIGPLAVSNGLLRNKIYSWPTTNSCAVDQDVVFFNQGEINGTPYDIRNRVVTRKGLDAAEYLLFVENLNHSCDMNTAPAGWDALSDNERSIQRCEFVEEIAGDIITSTQELLNEWNGNSGYAQSLLNAANEPGSDFDDVHQAVNRITDGLFYVDAVTKDAKLAIPSGIASNQCGQNPCPEDVESVYANHSIENIRNNLLSLQTIFTGEVENTTSEIGFDDFLVDVGAETTATNINNAINNALNNLDSYEVSLSQTLVDDPNQVQLTHEQVKAITDQMKTDFINELVLNLPASSAGDND